MCKTDRLSLLRDCLLIASIVEARPNKWWANKEIHELYNDNVGSACVRTVDRHLQSLERAGVVGLARITLGQGRKTKHYKWIGYPSGEDLLK